MSLQIAQECEESFARLNEKDTPLNWILWGFGDGGSSKTEIVVQGEGSGGLSELIQNLDDKQIQFGALKVKAIDDRGTTRSERSKGGQGTPMLKRARISVQRDEVFRKMQGVAVFCDWSNTDDISHQDVYKRLVACGGAHKPTHYDFGDGTVIQIDGFHEDLDRFH